MEKDLLIENFTNFLENTKDDWNYITPSDFYKNYYNKKPFVLDLREKKGF